MSQGLTYTPVTHLKGRTSGMKRNTDNHQEHHQAQGESQVAFRHLHQLWQEGSAGCHAAQDQPRLQTRGERQEPGNQEDQEGYQDKVGSKVQEDPTGCYGGAR